MTTFVLKRKLYADEENSGMSTGKKVALGVAGAGATAAGLFAGARRGYLGTNLMRRSNDLWGRAGVKLQNIGLNKMGNSMVESAGSKYGEAMSRRTRESMLAHNDVITNARLAGETSVAKGTKGYNSKQGFNEYTTQQIDTKAKEVARTRADDAMARWRRGLQGNNGAAATAKPATTPAPAAKPATTSAAPATTPAPAAAPESVLAKEAGKKGKGKRKK